MVATVHELASSATAVSYHEQDGYYARNDPEHRKASFWHGRAAGDLGLRGHVVPSRFESVLQGKVPKTDIRLGKVVEGERRHRPGQDITFSAPKSVSLEALVMGGGMVVVDGCIERRDFGDLPRFVRVVFLPCCQVLLSRPVVVGSVFG